MPIAEAQAVEWTGSATADHLTRLPSPADGRLRAATCSRMVNVSTAVVHCLIEGGPEPPIVPLEEHDYRLRGWCDEVLRRDARKKETLKGEYSTTTGLANKKGEDDSGFLKTFGHLPPNLQTYNYRHYPYLVVSRRAVFLQFSA